MAPSSMELGALQSLEQNKILRWQNGGGGGYYGGWKYYDVKIQGTWRLVVLAVTVEDSLETEIWTAKLW